MFSSEFESWGLREPARSIFSFFQRSLVLSLLTDWQKDWNDFFFLETSSCSICESSLFLVSWEHWWPGFLQSNLCNACSLRKLLPNHWSSAGLAGETPPTFNTPQTSRAFVINKSVSFESISVMNFELLLFCSLAEPLSN